MCRERSGTDVRSVRVGLGRGGARVSSVHIVQAVSQLRGRGGRRRCVLGVCACVPQLSQLTSPLLTSKITSHEHRSMSNVRCGRAGGGGGAVPCRAGRPAGPGGGAAARWRFFVRSSLTFVILTRVDPVSD